MGRLDDVHTAINMGETERARELLRQEVQQNPSAEAYYLCYQVAANDDQRLSFLNKAVELDPFHAQAQAELDALKAKIRGSASMPGQAGSQGYGYTGPTAGGPQGPTPGPIRYTAGPGQSYGGGYGQMMELADFSNRFFAYLIDAIILGIAGFILGLVLGGLFRPTSFSGLNQLQTLSTLLGLALNAVYYIYFMTSTNGQTIGKQVMKLRVVKLNGAKISALDAFLRCVVGYAISGLVLLIGFLWMLWDKDKQTWHDKIVQTVVIKER